MERSQSIYILALASLSLSSLANLAHSILLFGTLTKHSMIVLTVPSANRNAKGVLSLPTSEDVSSVIAEQTNGPMKDVLLPMMEKSAKKRNSWPGGMTSLIL